MANTLRFKRGLVATIPTALAGEPLFTTDTFDLYIGNGVGNTRFQKYIASGATTQILRGDGSLYTFPLAISSPSNGQVLKYNGTSWVNDSDAGITGSGAAGQVAYFTGATTQGGSNNLFWDNTNKRLGIGNLSPTTLLQLSQSSAGNPIGLFVTNSGASTLNNSSDIWFGNWVGASTTNIYNARISALNTNAITAATALLFYTYNGSGSSAGVLERARIFATGNFGIGTGATDNGLKLQVNGTGWFSGSVGIGNLNLTQHALRIGKNISGSVISYGASIISTIQSDVTSGARIFYSEVGTAAAAFTLSELNHYYAVQGTFGAGSTVTNQFGFRVFNNLTGATNNYGFYGDIAAATGRWNLYMNGSARNFLSGDTLIGSSTISAGNEKLQVTGTARFTDTIKLKNGTTSSLALTFNAATTTGIYNFDDGVGANMILQASGQDNQLVLHRTGNVLVGSGTNSGEKLQVNGTMKVTGNAIVGAKFGVGTTTTASAYLNGGVAPNCIQISGSGKSAINFQDTSGTNRYLNIGVDGSSAYIEAIYSTTPDINYKAAQRHIWTTNSVERMRLDGSGNLGLGVTPSAWGGPFKVMQLGTYGQYITGQTNNADMKIGINNYYNGTNYIYTTSGSVTLRYDFSANGYAWQIAPSGTAGANISFTQAMTLTANSRLILNSTSDTGEQLQVNGTAKVTGNVVIQSNLGVGGTPVPYSGGARTINVFSNTTIGEVKITNSTTGNSAAAGMIMTQVGLNSNIVNANNGNLVFGTNNTERMRLDGSGNLTVDTNTLFVDATNNRVGVLTTTPSEPLHVVGNILISGANSYKVRNLAGNDVNVLRSVTGGTNTLSSSSVGNHIAVGTVSAHDLLLCSSDSERIRLWSAGYFSHVNATNPTSSVTDSYIQYSADVTAGNAAPHFRTENGAVIKLYQETTAVGNAIVGAGGGSAMLDDDTFDGYTLRQIVRALRNQGILQ